MIDQLRNEIQERLDQLLAEADKLRRALAALGGGSGTTATPAAARPKRAPAKGRDRTRARSSDSRGSGAASSQPANSLPAGASSASARGPGRGRSGASRSRTRAPLGATRNAVLAALSGGQAMTAGQVAAATGLGRATVSTTLSKLAKSGELAKADRGYRRAQTPDGS
jgi:DNA-binding transcriptional ArsR family regulator